MRTKCCWGAVVLAGVLLSVDARAQEESPAPPPAAAAGAQEAPGEPAPGEAPAAPAPAPAPTPEPSAASRGQAAPPAAAEPYSYVIAPGDVLHILVWKEPTLTTDTAVRLDGKITVPLLGDVQAEGRTPDELTLAINTGLRQFLSVPRVTVSVAQALSARFYVIGEVAVPGSFPFTGRITVLQALAIAGGFKEFAKRERIMVIRKTRDGHQAIPFNYRDIEAGVGLEQIITLQPADTVVVP